MVIHITLIFLLIAELCLVPIWLLSLHPKLQTLCNALQRILSYCCCLWSVRQLHLQLLSPPWHSNFTLPLPFFKVSTFFHYFPLLLQCWPLIFEVIIYHISCILDHIVSYVCNKVFVTIPVTTTTDEPFGTTRGVKQMAKFTEQFLPGIKDCRNHPLHHDVLFINTTS